MKFYEMSFEPVWPAPGSAERERILWQHEEMVRGLLEQYRRRPLIGERRQPPPVVDQVPDYGPSLFD